MTQILRNLHELALITNHYCEYTEVRWHELTEITASTLLGLNSAYLAKLGNRKILIM